MVSDEYQDKISSNNNYYIPQNVPAGAIPLRIPIQNRDSRITNPIAAEFSQIDNQERDQSRGSELDQAHANFMEQSNQESNQKSKLFSENEIGSLPLQNPAPIVNVLNQGTEDEERALEKLQQHQVSSALTERLVQIEEMRKQNEIKQMEEQKSMEISSINLVDKEQVIKKLKELYYSIKVRGLKIIQF